MTKRVILSIIAVLYRKSSMYRECTLRFYNKYFVINIYACNDIYSEIALRRQKKQGDKENSYNMFNVLEWLEKSVDLYAKKTAVIDENGSLTYEELLKNSRCIGSALSNYVDMRTPVAVLADKGVNTLCTFFGSVYAGCFYVLLNPELPIQRLTQVQSVLEAKYIVTEEKYADIARQLVTEEHILFIEDLKKNDIDENSLNNVRSKAIDTDPLYANFTSGSTGVPKGVVVSHRSVIDFIDIFTDTFSFEESDIIGNQAPFDFDVSVKDIYSAIRTGATLVIIPRHLFSKPVELLDFICNQNITVMTWAVSALCLITTFHGLDYKVPFTVKKVLFSGEIMPYKHLKSWMEHLPDTTFVNLYGPTEITCNCTYHVIDRNRDYANGVPIGRAFPNEQVFLLDENNKEVTETDVAGEICVRGTALGLGYYRAKEQTDKHFVQNPLNDKYIDMIYRTGDLGKYNDDGELIFSGRKDFQIKHMGHRIELEEIESAMAKIEGIERVCCVFDEAKSKLYGFYIGDMDKKELHKKMTEKLPVFMVPGALRKVEDMPLTKNGKIDRKALLGK